MVTIKYISIKELYGKEIWKNIINWWIKWDRADIPQFDFYLESFHTILGNFVVSIHVLLDTETRTFQLNFTNDIDQAEQAVDHNAHIGTQRW